MISHVFILKIKLLNVIVLKYIKIQCIEVPAQHFIFIYSKRTIYLVLQFNVCMYVVCSLKICIAIKVVMFSHGLLPVQSSI